MLPVHVASLNGHTDCMKKLLSSMQQLNIDITDDCGRSCLHGAACSGYVVMN
jgi:ankyrin repeat protein